MINNYDALTLGGFMQIDAVLSSKAEDIDKQVRILAVLADMTEEQVLLLPLADYTAMAKESAFLKEPCKPAAIEEGWRFGELIPTMDFTKINTAQYIDFQGLAKGFPATLPELLAVFLVPEGHAYNDGYDLADVQRRVREVPFPVALGLSAFFFERFSTSIEATLTSWRAAGKKNPKKAREIEQKMATLQTLLRGAGVGSTS